jgi:chaperonin GroES
MITPLYDRVVLEPIAKNNKTESGVLLPATLEDGIARGKVLHVGPGSYQNGIQISPVLKLGNIVIFPKHAALEIKEKGETLLLIREGEVLAVVKE